MKKLLIPVSAHASGMFVASKGSSKKNHEEERSQEPGMDLILLHNSYQREKVHLNHKQEESVLLEQ